MTTRAIHHLERRGISFALVRYAHLQKGAGFAAEATGFPLERTIKTLVVDLGLRRYGLVLLAGDRVFPFLSRGLILLQGRWRVDMRNIVILALSAVMASAAPAFHAAADNRKTEEGKDMVTKNTDLKYATFAGGCFWCIEADFKKVEGIVEVVSGYTGGKTANPCYEEVCTGKTGHAEAVQVLYDPEKISYKKLLDVFWRHVDPTDPGGQFFDRGPQYRTAIFYADEAQRRVAEESKQALERSGRFDKPVVTEIIPLSQFFRAEGYHQGYYKKNPSQYSRYRQGSGRDVFMARTWEAAPDPPGGQPAAYSRPSEAEIKEKLTPFQYEVTQQEGTEPPFENEHWNNNRPGIYVDVVSGEPLFSSTDKFDSGTGWPSFTRPLAPGHVAERKDRRLGVERVEVRSKHADSHLGHLFPDGPPPTGLRYCINSAALRFIPREDLEQEGYGDYAGLFDTTR